MFNWNDLAKQHNPEKYTDRAQAGVIAQQVQTALPEAVKENPDGYLGVEYTQLIPLIIEAIKELDQKLSNVIK